MKKKTFFYILIFFLSLIFLVAFPASAAWIFLPVVFISLAKTCKSELNQKLGKWPFREMFSVIGVLLLAILVSVKGLPIKYLLNYNNPESFIYAVLFVILISFAASKILKKRKKIQIPKQEYSYTMISELMASINEEIWFRGPLLALLVSQIGLIPGALASALIFSASHIQKNRTVIGWTLINGFGFALIVAGTGSIYGAILGHALLNLLNKYSWKVK